MITVELPINIPGGLPIDIHITFKQLIIAVCVVAAALATVRFGFMHYAVAGIGEEVVLVDSPWFYGNSGVRDQPLKIGRQTVFNSTTEVKVSILPEPHVIEFKNMLTRTDTRVNVRFTVQMQITDSPSVISRFGLNWYKTTIDPQFLPLTQMVIRQVPNSEILAGNNSKVIESKIRDAIIDMIADVGVSVMLVHLSLDSIELVVQKPVTPPVAKVK